MRLQQKISISPPGRLFFFQRYYSSQHRPRHGEHPNTIMFLQIIVALIVHATLFIVLINPLRTSPSSLASTACRRPHYPFPHWPLNLTLQLSSASSAIVFFPTISSTSRQRPTNAFRTSSFSSLWRPSYGVRADKNNFDHLLPFSHFIQRSPSSSFKFSTLAHSPRLVTHVNVLSGPSRTCL